MADIARMFNVPLGEVTGPSKVRQVTYVRRLTAHILRNEYHLSYEQIGGLLGKRTRKSIQRSIQEIEERAPDKSRVSTDLNRIRTRLFA